MRRFLVIIGVLIILAPLCLNAQDDEIPLGDLARALRNSKPPDQTDVIDNDNLDRVMDKAESERLEGQPMFSISHGALMSVSPDGTCSLSFDARDFKRTAAAYISTDLPQSELAKLVGPAAVQDGAVQVSIHNGTQWELKEIVISLAFTQAQPAPPEYRFATLQSAPVVPSEKLPENTALYHLKGSAEPDSTGLFRAVLDDSNQPLSTYKDWHWSIVGARGLPPAAPPLAAHNSTSEPTLVAPSTNTNPANLQTAVSAPAPNSAAVTSPSAADQR
ncbi:MAG TPA: hypothetical protein VJO35_10085 [Terriglobales bacterium]|nr:hypothetical protein [Terriglobales bacterium]